MDRAMESGRTAAGCRVDGLRAGNLVAEAERATQCTQMIRKVIFASDATEVTP
jgi:hypothetical protein